MCLVRVCGYMDTAAAGGGHSGGGHETASRLLSHFPCGVAPLGAVAGVVASDVVDAAGGTVAGVGAGRIGAPAPMRAGTAGALVTTGGVSASPGEEARALQLPRIVATLITYLERRRAAVRDLHACDAEICLAFEELLTTEHARGDPQQAVALLRTLRVALQNNEIGVLLRAAEQAAVGQRRRSRGDDDAVGAAAGGAAGGLDVDAPPLVRLHARAELACAPVRERGEPAAGAADWTALPEPFLCAMLALLPVDDRLRAAEVCRAWRKANGERSVWRHVDLCTARRLGGALVRSITARSAGSVETLSPVDTTTIHGTMMCARWWPPTARRCASCASPIPSSGRSMWRASCVLPRACAWSRRL